MTQAKLAQQQLDGFLAPTLTLLSPLKTAELAQAIAAHLLPGDVLLLFGEIGSGKTHFARSVITARLEPLGLLEDIPSPTFTLVQTYQAGDIEIWHADLYRLTSSQEVIELGLHDAFSTAICLVEWPELLSDLRPTRRLEMHFTTSKTEEDTRYLKISPVGAGWDWLQGIHHD